MKHFDVIVIGGGQSGLAAGYYLRRTGLRFTILDNNEQAGGSWQHFWKSLRLFSPAQWSSLPGVIMKGGPDYYPTRDETIDYLKDYEQKYQLPIRRPVQVTDVRKEAEKFVLKTSDGEYTAKVIVSATGSFLNPLIPEIEGLKEFSGTIMHSSEYVSPDGFSGKRVAVVGEGNSGAQILSEVSKAASTIWITQKEPKFLPDHIDGRYLFDAASQMYEAKKTGKDYQPPSLGQIVMVPPVVDARSRRVLENSARPFDRIESDSLVWLNGRKEKVDVIIFCTGFRPSLQHLEQTKLVNTDGKISTKETNATNTQGLWLVGYGNWTGFASATLIGVGRSAKTTVEEIVQYLAITKEATPIL